MFNIVRFPCETLDARSWGYERVYAYERIKGCIVTARALADAAPLKNKKTLVLLESYDNDEGVVRVIAERGKACFLVDLAPVIRSYGMMRAIRLSRLRSFLRQCRRWGAVYALADMAADPSELRSARELVHIGLLLGLNEGQSKMALKMAGHYMKETSGKD